MNPWVNKTFWDMTEDNANKYGKRSAFLFCGQQYSYLDLKIYSERIACHLLDNNIRRGDNIGLWMSTRPEWIFIELACAMLGVAVVNLNTRFKSSELEYILKDSEAKAIFFQKSVSNINFENIIKELLPSTSLNEPGAWGETDFPALSLVVELGDHPLKGSLPLEKWLEKPLTARETEILENAVRNTQESDVANIFYTSGTTSFPKGAMQQQRSLLCHSYDVGLRWKFNPSDKILLSLPLCGVYGFNTMLATLCHGATGILMDVFEPVEAASIIEREKVTFLPMIDVMLDAIMIHSENSSKDFTSVRLINIAFMVNDPKTSIEQIEKLLPVKLVQAYGLSEANSMVLVGDPEDPLELRAKVGGPLVGETLAKVIDPETGERLGPGMPGELCLKGRNIMLGYYKAQEATEKAIDHEGWLRTGDLAEEGENGYIFYLSRLKDIIKLKGFTVSPAEIEFYIARHPAVQSCQVVAIASRDGEAAIACVIPQKPGLTEEEIISFCKQGMASFKVPKRVVFMDSFPVTNGPHGDKVQKNKLKTLVADMMNH